MSAGPLPADVGPAETAAIALVAGATGLVGSALCRQLQADGRYGQVVVLARGATPDWPAPLQVAQIDFARLDEWQPTVPIDTVFCALGTTMRKAGSETAFRAVDHDLVLAIARLAQRARARHFVFVSSVGADPASRTFYLRVKGETEAAIRALGLPHVVALRPALLLGPRTDGRSADRRPAERMAQAAGAALGPLMVGPLARYRPIEADRVARVMRAMAEPGREGYEVLEPPAIAGFGRSLLSAPPPNPARSAPARD